MLTESCASPSKSTASANSRLGAGMLSASSFFCLLPPGSVLLPEEPHQQKGIAPEASWAVFACCFHTLTLRWKVQQLGWEPVFSTLLCRQNASCKKHQMGTLRFACTEKHTTWCMPGGAGSVLLGLKPARLCCPEGTNSRYLFWL